jgi:hypothetical protein
LFVLLASLAFTAIATPAQTPAPAKGPDKEVAEKIALLKEVVADKKFARDAEGLQAIDVLLQKSQAGTEPKDQLAIVKALDQALTSGKLRPANKTELYVGAAAALGYCGADGAKVLKAAFLDKRFPEKRDWVPLREQFLKNLGRTKDESMVKFLTNEARRNPEAALQAAAGEALGNFEESSEAIRKLIAYLDDLLSPRTSVHGVLVDVNGVGILMTGGVLLVGIILVVEMSYHLTLNFAAGSKTSIFGFAMDGADPAFWVMAFGILVSGALSFEAMRRYFAREWGAVQEKIEDQLRREQRG